MVDVETISINSKNIKKKIKTTKKINQKKKRIYTAYILNVFFRSLFFILILCVVISVFIKSSFGWT